jgi:hypothetical protein
MVASAFPDRGRRSDEEVSVTEEQVTYALRLA